MFIIQGLCATEDGHNHVHFNLHVLLSIQSNQLGISCAESTPWRRRMRDRAIPQQMQIVAKMRFSLI